MDETKLDERLSAFENRQKLFISQRLEHHSSATKKQIENVREELKNDITGVRAASETAHKEIIKRLERIEESLNR